MHSPGVGAVPQQRDGEVDLQRHGYCDVGTLSVAGLEARDVELLKQEHKKNC